ncbi:MAG: LacI family DNA-binding transcriptional regulator [Bacteroidales bacterium]|nr:LacI family DNA-binding transcriptional regulator [Bacteroidales bacterium]
MAKQVKIKDIASMAGVSAGTVDRILHNRGNVSEASREAVERVLKEVGYKSNIHTSAISLRREYNIVITTPMASPGEYWESIQNGIGHAIQEYSDISIICRYLNYNQFDIYSCRAAYNTVMENNPDAVIIGATFITETQELCRELDNSRIPYVFIDSSIEGTNPIATFTTDQYTCGYLTGKLIRSMVPDSSEIAMFGVKRIGNQHSSNSTERRKGFIKYFAETPQTTIKEALFSMLNPEENEKTVLEFFRENSRVRGVAVINSRGNIIADILKKNGIDGITIISFDLTSNNIRCIRDGSISALLCQRPELQGFNAVKSIIHYLLYKKKEEQVHHIMPIDIIFKENLPYYREFMEV